jgi:hypothetical protein
MYQISNTRQPSHALREPVRDIVAESRHAHVAISHIFAQTKGGNLYVHGSVPQPSTPTHEIKQDQQTSEQKPDEGEAKEKRTPRDRSIDRERVSK